MPPVLQFAALGDETRCHMLELLRERPRPVHDLAAEFDISRPAISRHLRVLKDAGLVREEKRGRENVYAFEAGELAKLDRWLAGLRPSRAERPKGRALNSPLEPVVDLFGFAGSDMAGNPGRV
jgi:DNA-binding transcriptional ArsR family regulator